MARLFGQDNPRRFLKEYLRHLLPPRLLFFLLTAADMTTPVIRVDLPSPFGPIAVPLSAKELRETAYEILVAACRATGGKPLTYIPQSERHADHSAFSPSRSLQRSLTFAAASKVKKAFGIRSPSMKGMDGSHSTKKLVSLGELVRMQMGISEHVDARIRRGLLRVAAGSLGKRVESMVLPLELLQQFKDSDFPDQLEYEGWKARNLKVLQAGLLHHPLVPLNKSDIALERFRQFVVGASDRSIETGKSSDMQLLRSILLPLAYRSVDGCGSDTCHWADGFPFNLHLYQMLLEICFNSNIAEGAMIDEIDQVLELIKKTWAILGINQSLHNLCFTWILFHKFAATMQVENDLVFEVDNQLTDVANDAKATQDPAYSKILSSILTSIIGWTEKKLIAYHDTFNQSNIEYMQVIVSLGVKTSKVQVEDLSNEYGWKKGEETDVAYNRIDSYIRSSLRTAFAQKMKQRETSRRSSIVQNSPILSILAKDVGALAIKEKQLFSPILKKWHPLAAGVAVATLHSCYANELKQYIYSLVELTPDVVQVLKAADKLEKDLVNIAVEDSVDSDDGGMSLIREMSPYEAESSIMDLVRAWINTRIDRLKEWIDENLQQEDWNPRTNKEKFAASSIEVLRTVDETLEAYFRLPIPVHSALLPVLLEGLDRNLQHYATKAKSICGTRNNFFPELPPLTRCEVGSKLWKKKEKSHILGKKRPQIGSTLGLPQLCILINSLYYICKQLEKLKRKITSLRNAESTQVDASDGLQTNFELSLATCQEGLQQLFETIAYKVMFDDLSYALWDILYVGETSSSRIDCLLKELDPVLATVSSTVHDRLKCRVITALMKACFDGFLLVLLAGGPSRCFTVQECQIIEDDFEALRDLFLADGDGLPEESVQKAAVEVTNVLPLFHTDTESLIEQFKQMILEKYGSAAKSRYPFPQNPGHWSPTEPSTVLHVLCHRNDEAASKFLKKTYNLPKRL